MRLDALNGLQGLGIDIDQRNQPGKGARRIRPTAHRSTFWWFRRTRSWRSPATASRDLDEFRRDNKETITPDQKAPRANPTPSPAATTFVRSADKAPSAIL